MKSASLNIDLDRLNEIAQDYERQIGLTVIEKCPFIVQVGGLTVSTDETGKVITQNSNYPTQFTQKAVDEILKMSFKNGHGDKVTPEIYTRVEWYSERLKELIETINLLKSNPSLPI